MRQALRNIPRSRFVAAALGAALMAAFGGIAWAAIPDASHLVHACYKTADATKRGGAALSVVDSDNGGACRAGDSQVNLATAAPTSSARVVSGSVAADGTVLNQQGGLTATVLAQDFFLLSYPGFDPSHPGIVSGTAVRPYGATAPLTFERIASDDPALITALGFAPTGIVIRSRVGHDLAPFDVHIDLMPTP